MTQRLNQHSDVIQTYEQLLDMGYIRETLDHNYTEQPLFTTSISTVVDDPTTSIRTPEIAGQISGDYYSFIVLTKGCGYWVNHQFEHRIAPGSVLFMRAREQFTFHFTEHYKAISFNVPPESLIAALGKIPRHGSHIQGNTHAYLHALLQLANSDIGQLSLKERQKAEMRLLQQAGQLLDDSQKNLLPACRDVQRVIRQHAIDESFSIDWLASHCNASRRYIFKLFEQQPITLNQYIQQSQLGHAFTLLTDAQKAHLQLGDIALQSGFKTQAHFSRLFKQRYQLTPKQLRKIRQQTQLPL